MLGRSGRHVALSGRAVHHSAVGPGPRGRAGRLPAPARFAPLAARTGAADGLLPAAELAPVPWPGPPPEIAIDLHGCGPASHRLLAALRPGRLIAFGGRHGGGYPGPPWRPGEHE